MYRKILVPIDGSPHARYSLNQAVCLAQNQGPDTRVTLIHVGSFATFSELALEADLARWLEDEGQALLRHAEEAFVGTTVLHDGVFRTGDPAEVICQVAAEGAYDLVVIGTRGRGLFTELLLGSVSHKVIQHAPCPVLVVRRRASPA